MAAHGNIEFDENEKTLKKKIQEHYDGASAYYKSLWGAHIHHGYWITGKESKEEAQVILIEQLIERAGLRPLKKKGFKVLDVGCGIGGTSVYLAKNYNASTTGITISSTQVGMAKEHAAKEGVEKKTNFMQMDAEKMTFKNEFDVVWICEVLSHFFDKKKFFQNANRALKIGGKLVLVDWLKMENLTQQQEDEYVKPIESGMLLPELGTLNQYLELAASNGFHIVNAEDISKRVSKTWDICVDLIVSPALWGFAFTQGMDFVNFMKAFYSMRNGYASNAFVFAILIAEKRVDLSAPPQFQSKL